MAIHSNPLKASPKIGVLLSGGRKSLGGRGLQRPLFCHTDLTDPTDYFLMSRRNHRIRVRYMKLADLSRNSLKAIGRELGLDVSFVDGHLQVRELLPRPMWTWRLSSKSSFCRAVVASGYLTHRQMVHAALRYRLGRSKDDAVIYWQIDQLGQVHDGKLMWYGPDCHRLKYRNASWVMFLMKQHFGIPQSAFQPTHVFFGTHLLKYDGRCKMADVKSVSSVQSVVKKNSPVVAIVEAEKSAVILSELYPQYIWLAAGGMFELQVSKFLPLQHYQVILFPDTDPEGRAFRTWYDAAQQVMRSFFWPRHNPIHVSPLLELNATPSQKARKIDLVDYYFECQGVCKSVLLSTKPWHSTELEERKHHQRGF